jgi:hypothetical protein
MKFSWTFTDDDGTTKTGTVPCYPCKKPDRDGNPQVVVFFCDSVKVNGERVTQDVTRRDDLACFSKGFGLLSL